MKRAAFLLLFVAIPIAAAPRLRSKSDVLFIDQVASAFVIPVVGSTPGVGGTFFKSEIVLSNFRSVTQRIAVTFLPLGGASSPTRTVFELPAFENNGDLGLVSEDFLNSRMGLSGLGALVVEGIDAGGNPDANAQIDGFARVWTVQPASPGCPNPTGTVSQTMLAVPTNHLVGGQFPAFAIGLRQDDSFRTNVGIINLSSSEQTWTVDVFGTRGSISFQVRVPGNALMQTPVPSGTLGNLSVTFTLTTPSGTDVRWTAYAASVDNRTGDGWLRNATY
jgi:hypothetical protein